VSVQRGLAATLTAAAYAGGPIGILTYCAFSRFHCSRCGEIAKSQFPPDVQRQRTRRSFALAAIAALAVAVVVLGIICVSVFE
jgi:hypothetical protein